LDTWIKSANFVTLFGKGVLFKPTRFGLPLKGIYSQRF